MSSFAPREKLRRFRKLLGKTQAEFDEAVGGKRGRTQSYEKLNALVDPKRDYLQTLIDTYRSLVPGLTVDWFFDGVDDLPPGLKANSQSTSFFEYPILQEIPGAGATFNSGTLVSASTTQFPRGSFWAAIGDNDRSPAVRRGDHVLLVPEDTLKSDTMFAIRRSDGSVDLFDAARVGGIVTPTVLFEGQDQAGEGFQVVGKVVELRRAVGGGLIVFQSPTGLSVDMVTNVL